MLGDCILKDVLVAIVEYREARGWSEYELSKRSGIPQSTISSWYRTNTRPSMKSLQKICDVFRITISQLLGEEVEGTLTDEQKELLQLWVKFTPEQQDSFLDLFRKL